MEVHILSDSETFVFRDRAHAGQILGEALQQWRLDNPIVYAIPRGGIPVAVEIAKRVKGVIDIVVPRKLGAPGNPELAIGAVAGKEDVVLNRDILQSLNVPQEYLQKEIERKLQEIQEREGVLRKWIPPQRTEGRDVILTDDGVATGSTFLAGLQILRKRKPKRLIAAIPVLPYEVIQRFEFSADLLVAVIAPTSFWGAVGAYYYDFHQVSDREIEELISSYAVSQEKPPGS